MRFHLTNAPLFRGMTPEEIDALLSCLNAKARACKKGEIILMEGAPTEQLGVVLSGRVIIEMSDVWGNNSVLSSVAPGGTFAEAYACIPGEPLMVNVVAAEDSTVLLSTHLIYDVERIFDDVVMMDYGRLIAADSADALREKAGKSLDAYFREVFKC